MPELTNKRLNESPNPRINLLQLGSPTGLYGAERWILALIKHLDQNKFDIHVGAFQDDPSLEVPLCTEASKLGFKTKIFKTPGKFNPSAIFMLRNYIKSHNIHILHTHAYKQDIIGLLSTIGTRCKVVSTPHGWSKEPDIKLRLYEALNRAILPFFDAVVPLSQELCDPLASAKWYRFLFKLTHPRLPDSPTPRINQLTNQRFNESTNITLIKNGVDISEIDSVTEVAPEILDLKQQGKFIIGYIGQLIHRKGLDILIEATAKLPVSINWHLLIIGEGSLRKSLQQLASKLEIGQKISFLGFRKDRLSLLKGFDVFVLPSRLEGIPRCLMEAMAAGIPVVASDIPGCNDLIQNEETGLLFEPENPESLSHAINKVTAMDKNNLDKLTSSARKFIGTHFSAERMAREYEDLFVQLQR